MAKRFLPTLSALLVIFVVSTGCSSQREFSGWSFPKFSPLTWWKKDSPPSAVSKPSEIAGPPRYQSQPGYAAVGAGSTPPNSGYASPPSSAYPYTGQTGAYPAQNNPAPGWSAPPGTSPGASSPNYVPGPQVGYYGTQTGTAPAARVADRSGTGTTSPPFSGGAAGYTTGWASPHQNPYLPAPGYGQPVGNNNPQPVWAQPPGSTGSYAPAQRESAVDYSSPWQGSATPPGTGARYDVNSSRYNLSGNPYNPSAPASGMQNSGAVPGTGPQNPWGYTQPTIIPAPMDRGSTGYSSTTGVLPPSGGMPSLQNATLGSGGFSGTGGTLGGQTSTTAVQPTGYIGAQGSAAGRDNFAAAGGQAWNPGGPTPNMPGRTDYQPGNTGYQPGVTGYQPPNSSNLPNQNSSGTSSSAGQAAPTTSSPFLPGSVRPYVPPTSGSNNSGSSSSLTQRLGSAQVATTSATLPLGTAGSGSFCTLDGKCQ